MRAGLAAVVVAAGSVVLVPPAAHAAPVLAPAGPFTYGEQDPPLDIGTGTSVSGSNFYDGRYVDVEIAGATATEHLALRSVAVASTVDGEVSVVGSAVYIGNGTAAVPIGSIDAANDGRNGSRLRINFGSDFRNAGFETGDMAPWTAIQSNVNLGVSQIAGFTTVDTVSYPVNAGADDDMPVSATYNVAVTSANPPGPTEGTYALGLTSNMTTSQNCDVVHGPAAYSAAFDAVAGQTLRFDWRAFAGSDAYSVFGYLLNTSTGVQTEVLDATTTNTSGTTNWATASVNVPASGTYRFVFVSGTYDASCGRAAGASLYVDNFQVVSASFVDDAMVTKVIEKLTYENTSDTPAASRTVSVSARNVLSEVGTANIVVNVAAVDDAPVGSQITRSVENTPDDDTFTDLTGTLEFTDVDSPGLAFGIDGGTVGSYAVGGGTYDVEAVGTYGTLYVDSTTGAYRIVPAEAAIEAVTAPQLESFTVTAADATQTSSATLRLSVTIPPVPRNVTGVAGNGQVTVSWDQPSETTGMTGYVVTASPGGGTCTTGSVATTTCVVTGLTNGTAYTFTVTATYPSSTGAASVASDPVTPVGPPTAPLSVTGTPADGRVLVQWSPPANDGGSPVTDYTVSSSPGGGSCTTTGATGCTVLGLAVGSTYAFTVTATNALGTGPASAPISVTLRHPSTTSVSLSGGTVTEGTPVTVTATVAGSSPTGTVTFLAGGTSLGTASLSGGTASLTTSGLSAGTHSITAAYGGDGGNNPSTSAASILTVQAVTTTALTAAASEVAEGDAVELTATVAGASPTGTVEFTVGTTVLGTAAVAGGVATLATSSLAVGDHSVTATYSGDATNLGSTSPALTITVLVVAGVAVSASDDTPLVGDEVTLTAAVTGTSPTGFVDFYDGTTLLGTALVVDGTASIVVDGLVAGSHAVTAVYGGDDANTGATSSVLALEVGRTEAAVALGASDDAPVFGDEVTVTATVSGNDPTGTVEFFDGATSLGTAPVVDGVATLAIPSLAVGPHAVTAAYGGDDANSPATSSALDVTVGRVTPTLDLRGNDVPTSEDQVVVGFGGTLRLRTTVAGIGPSGTVRFFATGTGLQRSLVGEATVVDGTAVLDVRGWATGVYDVSADYGGDEVNAPTSSAVLSVRFLPDPSLGLPSLGAQDPGAAGGSGTEGDRSSPGTLPRTGGGSQLLGTGLVVLLGGLALRGTLRVVDRRRRTA